MGAEEASGDTHDRATIRLEAAPLHLLFSESALLYSAAADLFRGDALVFHLKYLPLRKGFVLNDRHGDSWGEEVFFAAPDRDADGAILATVTLGEAGPVLQVTGSGNLPLGGRFDLSGALRAAIPPAIGLGRPVPAALPQAVAAAPATPGALAWDRLLVCDAGFFLEGWADDRAAPVVRLVLADPRSGWRGEAPVHRLRRPDVETHLRPATPYEFGIWTAAPLPPGVTLAEAELRILAADGTASPLSLPQAATQPPADFLDTLLVHFGQRRLIGDATARALADLDAGHGAMLAHLHGRVAATRATRLEARFGPQHPQCRLSLVCVLFGVADLLYLLVAQFARFGPLDGVEFVFVSNSPELEEALVRDAEIAAFLFQARIVLLGLNRNCGFSHANNVGVGAARASTVCIINPDVHPRDAAAVAHLLRRAEAGLGAVLAGARLHYSDGSVMHEGMEFAEDRRLSALAGSPVWSVEHPRKGFPEIGGDAVRSVPAVSGALMLLDKALYDRVQGFDTGYIHGYYEDADLCLRLREAGAEVVLDRRLEFWHYEGRGSAGHPAGAGARLHNRWRFTRRWADRLRQARDG